jgi:hypothetical protein
MKTGDILLMIAKGVVNTLKEELAERNAIHERQKRSKNLRKGSIDVEFRVKE